MSSKLHFSQKHPFLFGLFLLFMAVALIIGAMAFFYLYLPNKSFSLWDKPAIGIVHIKGTIASSRKINDWIYNLLENSKVKGVVLRINSPGGGVGASQEIFEAAKKLASKKRVYVSMGAVAASGGYYISCAGQRIFASSGTITGSIGVKAQLTNIKNLADKLGIQEDAIVSGKLKNAGSPFQNLTEEQRKYFQDLVNDLFEQFVADVASSRKLDRKKVLEVADGRALTGKQALKVGLIDEIGGFRAVITALKRDLGLKNKVELLEGPSEEKGWLGLLRGMFNMFASHIGQKQVSRFRFQAVVD